MMFNEISTILLKSMWKKLFCACQLHSAEEYLAVCTNVQQEIYFPLASGMLSSEFWARLETSSTSAAVFPT
jgi:hypothetical protein